MSIHELAEYNLIFISPRICSLLVFALARDLNYHFGNDVRQTNERLIQLPSVWCLTGFIFPQHLQQEAGRSSPEDQQSFANLAGEEPSSDSYYQLERQDKKDNSIDALYQLNIHHSCFPSSSGLSFFMETGAILQAAVTWDDYSPPSDSDEVKPWIRISQCHELSFPIQALGSSNDISQESDQQGLCLRWIAPADPSNFGSPPKTTQIGFCNAIAALQFGEKQAVESMTMRGKIGQEDDNKAGQEYQSQNRLNIGNAEHIKVGLR